MKSAVNYRILKCPSLPLMRPDKETLYALRTVESPSILMVAPVVHDAFQKLKSLPGAVTEEEYRLLNLALDQAMEAR